MMRLLSSFWWFSRPILVLFFLYLSVDAFFRWDKFHYHAPFSEFIPALALISILWCIAAFAASLLFFVAGIILRRVFRIAGRDTALHHYLFFAFFFICSGIASWFVKRDILHLGITLQIASIEFICSLLIAISATLLLRSKAIQWIDIIQKRITPIVWLYTILVIVSIPFIAYETWGKPADAVKTENFISSSSTVVNRPNIILVTFDALSARHMSVYGYDRPTTPFITEWSKKASLFSNLEAAGTLTALTTASLMTGKRAWTDNVWKSHSFDALKSNRESLPVILKKNGYYTMALTPGQSPHELVKSIGKNGFDFTPPFYEFLSGNSLTGHLDVILARLFDGKIQLYKWVTQGDFILAEILILTNRYRNNSITDYPPEKVFNRFISHIQNNPQRPFFAWIHLHPPHFPYLPPEPYMGKINPSSKLRRRLDQYNVSLMADSYKKGSTTLEELQPQIDILRDRYDEFIMYCDNQFKDFIKRLDAMNESKKNIMILSSSHGSIFTPAYLGTGGSPKEHVTHIPLIIREPGQNKQNIINDVVEQIDIPSTILELAHMQEPSWMEGRSLVPLLHGKKLPEQPAFSVDFRSNPSGQAIHQGIVAARDGNYKLIHDLARKTSRLFNIKNDPDEQNNLIDKESAISQHLLDLIMDKINKVNQALNRRPSDQ